MESLELTRDTSLIYLYSEGEGVQAVHKSHYHSTRPTFLTAMNLAFIKSSRDVKPVYERELFGATGGVRYLERHTDKWRELACRPPPGLVVPAGHRLTKPFKPNDKDGTGDSNFNKTKSRDKGDSRGTGKNDEMRLRHYDPKKYRRF